MLTFQLSCFDYGNAETSSRDTGNGHMEAIYYGDCNAWGTGGGSGPWLMADLGKVSYTTETGSRDTDDMR